jgi:hypothetical protein
VLTKEEPGARLARHTGKDPTMQKTALRLALLAATLVLSACAPVLVGGAVAVVADEAIEQEKGGDGLF